MTKVIKKGKAKNLGKSIFKNSIYKIILNIFNLFVPLLVMPHINSLINKGDLGAYNSANSYFGFFLIFAVFGVYNFGIREASYIREDKNKLSITFTNLFLISVITSVLTSLLYFFFVCFFIDKSVRPLYFVLIIQLLSNMLSVEWLNEAIENYGFITLKTVIVRTLYVVSVFLFVKSSDDVLIFSIIMSLSVLLNNLLSFLFIKKHIRFNFSDFSLKRYLKPLFTVLMISNVNFLYTQLDKVFLSSFSSGIMVTEYTNPSNIINMVSFMLSSLVMVSVPRLSYYLNNNKKDEYLSLLNFSAKSFFVFLAPACIGLFCLSYQALFIYTNGAYAYSYPVLQMFSLRLLVSSLYSVFAHQILYINRKERQMVFILLLGGVLNLILNTVLLIFGVLTPVYTVITTAVSEAFMLFIMYRYIKRKLCITLSSLKYILKYIACSLTFIPITYFVKKLSLSIFPHTLVTVFLCMFAYFVLLLFTKDEMLFYFLKKLFKRLKKEI